MGSETSRTESVAEAGGAETGWELIVNNRVGMGREREERKVN
jgi:hypothetical protein